MQRLSRSKSSFKGRTRHISCFVLRPIRCRQRGVLLGNQCPVIESSRTSGRYFAVFRLQLERLPAFCRDQTQAQRAERQGLSGYGLLSRTSSRRGLVSPDRHRVRWAPRSGPTIHLRNCQPVGTHNASGIEITCPPINQPRPVRAGEGSKCLSPWFCTGRVAQHVFGLFDQ